MSNNSSYTFKPVESAGESQFGSFLSEHASLLNPDNIKARTVEGFDDDVPVQEKPEQREQAKPEQPEVQENSVSPVNSVSPAEPAKSPAEQYMDMAGVPRLTPEQQAKLDEIRRISQRRDEPVEHHEQPERVEIQDMRHSIQNRTAQQCRANLEANYDEVKRMAVEYGKLGKTYNKACEKYGYSDAMSEERKQQILDAHPEMARAKEQLDTYGEAYRKQINRLGRAAQKCQENGVDFSDIGKRIQKDVEKGEFDIKGNSALEKISQAIAERIAKVVEYVKRKLGFGKTKEVQQEQQATPSNSTPTLG